MVAAPAKKAAPAPKPKPAPVKPATKVEVRCAARQECGGCYSRLQAQLC